MRILVIVVFVIIVGIVVAQKRQINREKKEIDDLKIMLIKGHIVNKNLTYLSLLYENAERIERYLINQHIFTVGIYGMDKLGIVFEKYLAKTHIKVCYGIDRNKNLQNDSVEIRTIEETSNDMDMIIVTAEYYFHEIQENVSRIVNVPVVRLSNLLEEVLLVAEPIEDI